MKNFTISIVNSIKAFDIKEAFAMDNLFETWLDSNLDSLSLELIIGETRTDAEFTVKLYDLDNANSCVVLSGIYSNLATLKEELKTLLRDLNTKTEAELTALTTPEEQVTKKNSNTDSFLSLPIGHPFACDLPNGDHISEAIKISDQEITFKHYGKMKTVVFEPSMTCDPEWPIHPDLKLIQDPYNNTKQYILKRENFLEITVFQMVHGHQVGRAKFTEDELLAVYDFIHQYQLNKLLSGNCESASRLYKIKHAFLSGDSKDWRTDAKLHCINPHSLRFMAHVARENALKPLILRTAEAMKKTRSGTGVKCWWSYPCIDRVLREAEYAGFISRMSTTQVEWNKVGIDTLHAAKKRNFTFYVKAA